jgi:hypothetical protein
VRDPMNETSEEVMIVKYQGDSIELSCCHCLATHCHAQLQVDGHRETLQSLRPPPFPPQCYFPSPAITSGTNTSRSLRGK